MVLTKLISFLCTLVLLHIITLIIAVRYYDANIRQFTEQRLLNHYVNQQLNIDLKVNTFTFERHLNHWQISVSNLSLKTPSWQVSIDDLDLSFYWFEDWFPKQNSPPISTLEANTIDIIYTPISSQTSSIQPKAGEYTIEQWLTLVNNSLQETIYQQPLLAFFFSPEEIIHKLSNKKSSISLNNLNVNVANKSYFDIRQIAYDHAKNTTKSLLIDINQIQHNQALYQNISLNLKQNLGDPLLQPWQIDGQIKSIDLMDLNNNHLNYLNSIHIQGEMNIHPSEPEKVIIKGALKGTSKFNHTFNASQQTILSIRENVMALSLSLSDAYIDDHYLGNLYALFDLSANYLELSSDHLEIKPITLVLPSLSQQITAENIHGRIQRFLLSYDFTNQHLHNLIVDIPNVDIHFDQLPYLSDIQKVNLSYSQIGIDKTLKVSIPHVELSFDKPPPHHSLKLNTIDLNLTLQGNTSNIQTFIINTSTLYTNHSSFQLKGKYDLGQKHANNLQFTLQSNKARIEDITPLLQQIPDENPLSWLKNLISGEAQKLEIHIEQNLHSPSTESTLSTTKPEVSVLVQSEQAELIPYQGWSMIEMLQSTVTYQNDQLAIRAKKAIDKTSQLQLYDPDVLIDFNSSTGHLSLKGVVQTQGTQATDFIQSSPIPKLSGWEDFWQNLTIDGQVTGSVNVYAPIVDSNKRPVTLNTHLSINQAKGTYKNYQVHQVQGQLIVEDNIVHTSTLTGVFDQQLPIKIKIIKPQQPNQAQNARYHLTIPKAENLLNFAAGHTTFTGYIRFNQDDFSLLTLTVSSSLQNVSFNTPSIFGKKQGQIRSFSTRVIKQSDHFDINVIYDKHQLSASYHPKSHHINPFMLSLGNVTHPSPIEDGGLINIHTPYINIDAWFELFNPKIDALKEFTMPSFPFPEIHVNTDILVLNDTSLHRTQLHVNKFPHGQYQAKLNSDKALITLDMVENAYLNMNINKLDIRWDHSSNTHTPINPSQDNESTSTLSCIISELNSSFSLPTITLKGNNIRLNQGLPISLSATGELKNNRLLFQRIQFNDSNATINLNDFVYQQDKNNPTGETTLKATLKAQSLSPLLTSLGLHYSNYIAQDITSEGSFKWQGAPWCVGKNNIQADIHAITGIGAVKGVEPGLGRLLSVLNLRILLERFNNDETIRQRKDELQTQGLSFDKTEIEATIHNQSVIIPDLRIDSPIAVIEMDGEIDNQNNTYDFNANIKPEVIPTIVTLSTIFGGPVGGLLAYFSSELLSILNLDDELLSYDLRLAGDINKIDVERQK